MIELTTDEKIFIKSAYGEQFSEDKGYRPNQVEDIQELTAEEQKFFSGKNFVSPNFSVQMLYKVSGKIIPLKFNRAVHSMMVEDKNFRANFCNIGTRTVKVIFYNKRQIPEIVYKNLSHYQGEELDDMLTKIMEADRRVQFDLQNGYLMRFSVFHTAENEYAVLVSMAQLVADNFNAKNFFHSVFTKENYKVAENNHTALGLSQLETPVREYWRNILKDLPPFKGVPFAKKTSGEYYEKSFREKIPPEILSDLREKAQSNKAMLMTILQTAWGFLLQTVNKVDETAFCRLLLNSKAMSSGVISLDAIPIRLNCSPDETVESIVNKQFRQLVVSQSYSFFDWNNLQDLIAGRGIKFDHFLSFLNFRVEQKIYSESAAEPLGNFIEKNFWDNCGMKLGVYFQYSNATLSVTFQYDANQFAPAVGMRFARIYNLILQNMLIYWNLPFSKFIENVTNVVSVDPRLSGKSQQQDDRKIIVDFISANKILQGEDVGSITMFSEQAKLERYFEGDRVDSEILARNLVFVVEGKMARSLDTGDGWYNALDIISKGGWLNETVFLKDARAKIAAEVLTENATILLIPLANVDNVVRQYPNFYKNFMTHILKQLEKFQRLWLQS